MKTHAKIILNILLFLFVISCSNTKKNRTANKKSEEFYKEYTKNMFQNEGLDVNSFNLDSLKIGLNHEENINNINLAVEQFKRIEKQVIDHDIQYINLLITLVKENKLEDKEPFYKKLLAQPTDKDKYYLYQEELKKTYKNISKAKNADNIQMLKSTYYDNSYLNIIAHNKEGDQILNIMPLIIAKTEDGIKFTIEKYDTAYQAKQKDFKLKESEANSSNRFILGVNVK